MSKAMGGPLNHLSGRRQGRSPLRHPVPQLQQLLPDPIIPPGMFNTQDCCLDSGHVDVCKAMADPYIVSHIVTGYIGQEPGPANQVLVAAGQEETNGVTDDDDRTIAGHGSDGPV
jgi:hypothetical protein